MSPLLSIEADNGGRPAANDDFLALQSQPLALGLPALLLDMPPCIVSGCKVSKIGTLWAVSAGMVWDGAKLLPYAGQFNVMLPAMFAAGAVVMVDERAYQTGGTKTTINGQAMELVPVVAGAPNLLLDTYGGLTFWHRLQEKTRSTAVVEWVNSFTSTNYDATTGLGKPGTEAWGWGLANGQGGRVNLAGRVPVGLDPQRPDYATLGLYGGAEAVGLTADNNGPHSHDFSTAANSVTYDGGNSSARAYNFNDRKNDPTTLSGSGTPHENRMPYATLLARQWVGY